MCVMQSCPHSISIAEYPGRDLYPCAPQVQSKDRNLVVETAPIQREKWYAANKKALLHPCSLEIFEIQALLPMNARQPNIMLKSMSQQNWERKTSISNTANIAMKRRRMSIRMGIRNVSILFSHQQESWGSCPIALGSDEQG